MSNEHQKEMDTGEQLLQRARELHGEGLDWHLAWNKAFLESRVSQWPNEWGDKLHIVIYGDFDPPSSVIHIQHLGITIYPEKLESSVARSATCSLTATVDVTEKSISAIIDAERRINELLGALTLVRWVMGHVDGGLG